MLAWRHSTASWISLIEVNSALARKGNVQVLPLNQLHRMNVDSFVVVVGRFKRTLNFHVENKTVLSFCVYLHKFVETRFVLHSTIECVDCVVKCVLLDSVSVTVFYFYFYLTASNVCEYIAASKYYYCFHWKNLYRAMEFRANDFCEHTQSSYLLHWRRTFS